MGLCHGDADDARRDMALRHDSYRLADEGHKTILVACSKCDWRAGYRWEELVSSYGVGVSHANTAQQACEAGM